MTIADKLPQVQFVRPEGCASVLRCSIGGVAVCAGDTCAETVQRDANEQTDADKTLEPLGPVAVAYNHYYSADTAPVIVDAGAVLAIRLGDLAADLAAVEQPPTPHPEAA
jgi:hypothetical protein